MLQSLVLRCKNRDATGIRGAPMLREHVTPELSSLSKRESSKAGEGNQ